MKQYPTATPHPITARQNFKVKIGTGTASIQWQADTEGYDEIEGGAFTTTGSGVIDATSGSIQAVLTGDAEFFMGRLK